MTRHVSLRRVLKWGAIAIAAVLSVAVSAGRTGGSADLPARASRAGVYRASSRGAGCLSSPIVAPEDPDATLLGHVPQPDNRTSLVAWRNGRPLPVIAAAPRVLAVRHSGSALRRSPVSTVAVVRAFTPDVGRAPPPA